MGAESLFSFQLHPMLQMSLSLDRGGFVVGVDVFLLGLGPKQYKKKLSKVFEKFVKKFFFLIFFFS